MPFFFFFNLLDEMLIVDVLKFCFMLVVSYCLFFSAVEDFTDGSSNLQYLEQELGIEALRTMKRIKDALDPNNIMNPGKVIPPHVCF